MTANEFRFEGYFGVKDGRKWKNRYCVFKQPTKFLDHFKLHLYKDHEDYAMRSKTTDVTPFEDVLGYETGHCIDKDHPHCILMVGRKSVFFVGFPELKQMIEWSRHLGDVLKCIFFRLTLESVENNRNLPRQAGSLHIQRSRICFIREPESSLSKLVCAWDVKEVRNCGIDPETRYFFIVAGTGAGKMRGKYFFSCPSGGIEKLRSSVADTLNDRVLYQPAQNSSTGRSPPSFSSPPAHVNGPVTSISPHHIHSMPRRRQSSNSQPLPPPPLPPPPPPPPQDSDIDDSAPFPLPPPPSSSPPGVGIQHPNFLRRPSPPLRTGSHECLPPSGVVMRHEDDSLFPNATLTRSGKQSSPGTASVVEHRRHLCEDDTNGRMEQRRSVDLFRRSNSLNIQSTKQEKLSGNILQRTCRLFKRRSRSETDFSGGSSSVGSASGTLAKDVASFRSPSVEADGDDEVFDDNPLFSSASAASSSPPDALGNSVGGADVALSPIREDRTPSGPGPSINASSRTRSISATYSGSQGMRLSSTGSTGTGENSTLKRNENVDSADEGRPGDPSDLVQYPNNPFPDWEQRPYVNTSSSQGMPLGYVTLPNTRKGAGLHRSHSTVSGSSHHSPASNTAHLMSSKPRFGAEYIPRQTLRSVSQSSAADSAGSPLSTTPAMACPLPTRPTNQFSDPMGSGYRHYVNFSPAMPGIIPSDPRSVAAKTGYVNLDMRDDFAPIDMRPGQSVPDNLTDCSPQLHYAKLHFKAHGCGSLQSETTMDGGPSHHDSSHHLQQRLSSSAEQPRHSVTITSSRGGCDYIEVDTSRTKALSKLVSEQTPGVGLIDSDDPQPGDAETPIINDTTSVRHDSQDMIAAIHSSSANSSNGGSSGNSNSSRNPSFRKLRNPFSTRKNSEPAS